MTNRDSNRCGATVVETAHRIVREADSWLQNHDDTFDPIAWDEAGEIEYRRKAFSELALYVYVGEAYGPELPDSLRSLVVRRATTDRFLSLVRRNPTRLTCYGSAITFAVHTGATTDRGRETIEWAVSHPAVWSRERVPYRDLDLARLATVAGVEPPIDVESVIKRSSLTTPPDPIVCTVGDAYALTHDILFCSDFGVGNYTFGDLAAHDLRAPLDGLLLRFVAAGHTDLALELLACGTVTGQLSSPLVEWTLEWIWNLTVDRGHVPGPDADFDPPALSGESASQTDSTSEIERPDSLPDEWVADYHTSLVGGIVGRLLLQESPHLLQSISPKRDWDHDTLFTLGAAVDALANYNLEEGAARITELSGSALPSELLPVVDCVASFLRAQRRSDNSFGYWPDERRRFEQLGHDMEAFDRGPLRQTSDACREALEVIDKLRERETT